MLHDDIVAVIDAMYCQSCKGHPGRNTALDGLMEKINKLAKQMIHGIATEERVSAVVPWINVIEPVESGWQKLYPNYAEDGRAYIGAPNYDVDIAMIVEWFREHIGRDFASATAFSNYDVFRGRSGIGLVSPWEHIETLREPTPTTLRTPMRSAQSVCSVNHRVHRAGFPGGNVGS